MSDRQAKIEAFLAEAGWQNARREPLAGDLSPRKYLRLHGTGTAILMDANTTMVPFVKITGWLRENRFSAPEILADRANDGLILLEDFGDVSVNRRMEEHPEDVETVHNACVDLLLALRATPLPDVAAPSADELVAWTKIVDTSYPGIDPIGLREARSVLADTIARLMTNVTPSLRDFHADNLMWLRERPGIQKLGLLDYQDAFLTHPVYDLVSFLTDARVNVPRPRRETTLQSYLDRSGDHEEPFRTAFAAFSAQRNLRILHIFASAARAGRKHHLPKIPRVHNYLTEALEHPIFDDVRQDTLRSLPNPQAVLEALA